MTYLSDAPCLEFPSAIGTFSVKPVASTFELYALCIETEDQGLTELARFCGINDAVLAVSRQETGYAEWDRMSPRELPFRVHDIACWKLCESSGTKSAFHGSKSS